MKSWKFVLIAALLILSQILAACASPTPAPTEEAKPAEPEAPVQVEPTAVPEPTKPPEPVDITLWAQATVTESGPPPDDWVVYDILRDELGINLEYVIIPPAGDGEAKLNAAAAANDLPDIFQITTANNTGRDALHQYYELGLLAPVDDMFAMGFIQSCCYLDGHVNCHSQRYWC